MTAHTTYLTDRFFVAVGFVQLVGVLSIVYGPPVLVAYLVAIGFLVLAMLLDRRFLIEGAAFGVTVEIPQRPELGQKVVVKCQIRSRDGRVLGLSRLSLMAPSSKCLTFLHERLLLSPTVSGGEISCDVTTVATAVALGYEELDTLVLTAYSRFFIWFRRMTISISRVAFRVVPTHREVSEQAFIELAAEQRALVQGSRRMIRGRAPDQFHSIRKYHFPDPIRQIDPKKTAKFNELMTRVYDSLYHHHLVLALDVGRAMCGSFAGQQKNDYYLSACLALAQNAMRSHDRISFFSFSQQLHHMIAPTKTLVSFEPLFRGVEAVQPREIESNYELLNQTISHIAGQRSIVLILTDPSKPSVQEALLKSLPSLCRQHLTVVVGLIDEAYALDQTMLATENKRPSVAAYSKLLYTYWLDEGAEQFRHRVAALGGSVLVVPRSDWLGVVIRLYTLLRSSLSM